MPDSPSTTLVRVLDRHHLLEPAQLQALNEHLKSADTDPRSLGEELVRRQWLTPFQVQHVLQGRAAQLVLGSWTILQPLGDGGCGQVFKARDQAGRLAAIKVLHKDATSDPEAVQRFQREIEAAGQLDHPNVIRAYEAGPIGPRLAIVMEYVAGQDLERIVQRSGPLPVEQACEYLRQAALGLSYAQERGLVHRDIKPSNLMVTDGQVKILDFGLARLSYHAQGSTTANLTTDGGGTVTQGTPDYMSPEQALDFHGADVRSDLYSLGCTFYFLLTGRAPFAGGALATKLLRHQNAAPPPVSRADLPSNVKSILDRLLAKEPAKRFQTPAELIDALGKLSSPAEPPARRRRPPYLLLSAAASVALLLCVGIWLALPGSAADPVKSTAEQAKPLPSPPPPPAPDSVEATVPEARDYQLVYDLNLAKLAHDIVYDDDRHAKITQPFDRVAYFIELKRNDGTAQYLYVSMDAFTADLKKIGVPTVKSGASFQIKVANLNVYSNVSSIVTGTQLTGGNIEFWPNNYTQNNAAKVPNADSQKYDFGDQMTQPLDGYGSMQVHNHEAKQTLFAVNHWVAGKGADIGIGNNPNPNGNPDWTFANNAGNYRTKRLRILVHFK